LLIEGESNQT